MEKIGETKKLSDCVTPCYLKGKNYKTKHKFSGRIEKKTELFWSRYSFGIQQTKNPMAGKDLVIVCLHLVQKLPKTRILSRENLLIA